jgi:hypothetical protein
LKLTPSHVDDRSGSEADVDYLGYVRFAPESGQARPYLDMSVKAPIADKMAEII